MPEPKHADTPANTPNRVDEHRKPHDRTRKRLRSTYVDARIGDPDDLTICRGID